MIIEIKGIEIDLKKLGIDFIPNTEQMQALEHLANFLESDNLTTVLSGNAGSGKTSVVRILLQYVKLKHRMNVRLVAPTHKAKSVLGRLSNNHFVTTLHKLLGLKPDFNILEFDARTMAFLDSLKLPIFESDKDLIIIDECSMITNELFDMVVKKAKGKGKVIFLGDDQQIQPVNQSTHSKVFSKTDYPRFHLGTVVRQQDNPLINTLTKLRNGETFSYESDTDYGKGLRVHNIKDFQIAISEHYFSLEKLNESPQGTKIIAYTNSRVQAFNKLARKLMGIGGKIINEGEILTAYDSYTVAYEDILHNGSDYMIQKVVKTEKLIPSYGLFKGYVLTLKYPGDTVSQDVFLLDPEASDTAYKNLGIVMESARLKAVKKKYLWKNYFAISESFVTMRDITYQNRVIKKKTLDYGYAITCHKSQSSSYTHVFVDIDNISICKDPIERRQLEYVALSRPTHLAHILKN
jgi:hypothetical protein